MCRSSYPGISQAQRGGDWEGSDSEGVSSYEHSGIVVDADPIDPLRLRILSKWGSAHEVIHGVGDCPYDARNIMFYRMTR